MTADRDFAQMVGKEQAKLTAEHAARNGRAAVTAGAEFAALGEDRYRFSLPAIGTSFEVDRLRRDHHELQGELCVRCDLPGAITVDGSLSIADFNFSSARARQDRAKLLSIRARTKDLDWDALTEEFCQRVLQADRAGQPAIDLRTLARPVGGDDLVVVEGWCAPEAASSDSAWDPPRSAS